MAFWNSVKELINGAGFFQASAGHKDWCVQFLKMKLIDALKRITLDGFDGNMAKFIKTQNNTTKKQYQIF